jgi:hypothetical protein
MESNTLVDRNISERWVVLLPGPQSFNVKKIQDAVRPRCGLMAGLISPFVLLCRSDRPLSLEELRIFADELREADNSRRVLILRNQ